MLLPKNDTNCPNDEISIPRCNSLNPCKETVFVFNDIVEQTLWTNNKQYILMAKIHIREKAPLIIQQGTVVFANTIDNCDCEEAPQLIVDPMGTLVSKGTEECPIIFTTIVCVEDIFALCKNGSWKYKGGLGPFADFWDGILVNGTINIKHTFIYFAGITANLTNALSIYGTGIKSNIKAVEILWGQGHGLYLNNCDYVVNCSTLGLRGNGSAVYADAGTKVNLCFNVLIEAVSSQLNSLVVSNNTEIQTGETCTLINNNTFLALTKTLYMISSINEGIFWAANNIFVGPCDSIFNIDFKIGSTTLVVDSCPPTFDVDNDPIFYIGPNAWGSSSNGVYYSSNRSDDPFESSSMRDLVEGSDECGQILKKVVLIGQTSNLELFTTGGFLDICPCDGSCAYSNNTNIPALNHVQPILCESFFRSLDNCSIACCNKPVIASGAVENCDLICVNRGYMSHLLVKHCKEKKGGCCGEQVKPRKKQIKYCSGEDNEIEVNIEREDIHKKEKNKLLLLGALAGTALFSIIRKI